MITLELLQLQAAFEPVMKKGDYSFIGPEDQSMLETFIKAVANVAPGRPFGNSVHHVLSNKEAVRQAVNLMPLDTGFRVYAVSSPQNDSVLLHGTITEYCKRNNIAFDI